MTEYVQPKRVGGHAGTDIERVMEEQVDGVDGIRKKVLLHPDGSTVRLDTRAGNPRVIVSKEESTPFVRVEEVGECACVPNNMNTAFYGWGAPFTYDGNGHTTHGTPSGAFPNPAGHWPGVILRTHARKSLTPETMRSPEIEDEYGLSPGDKPDWGDRYYANKELLVSWTPYADYDAFLSGAIYNAGKAFAYVVGSLIMGVSVYKNSRMVIVTRDFATGVVKVLCFNITTELHMTGSGRPIRKLTSMGSGITLFDSTGMFVSFQNEAALAKNGMRVAVASTTSIEVFDLDFSKTPVGCARKSFPISAYAADYIPPTLPEIPYTLSYPIRVVDFGGVVARGSTIYAVCVEHTGTQTLSDYGTHIPIHAYSGTSRLVLYPVYPISGGPIELLSRSISASTSQSYPPGVGSTWGSSNLDFATVFAMHPYNGKIAVAEATYSGSWSSADNGGYGFGAGEYTETIKYISGGQTVATMAQSTHTSNIIGGDFARAVVFNLGYYRNYTEGGFVSTAGAVFGKGNTCLVIKNEEGNLFPYHNLGAAAFFDGKTVYQVPSLVSEPSASMEGKGVFNGGFYHPRYRWKLGIV